MSLFIYFFTNDFHLLKSLLQCGFMYSKSVIFIYMRSCFQYLTVFVCSSQALLKMQLCSVFSYKTVFPIITKVFLRFSCDSFLIPSSISVASFAPYIGDLSMALIALLFDKLYFSCIWDSFSSGEFIRPYCTQACIAPIIRFLPMFCVMPPPLSIKGTSCALVLSAFCSCLAWCSWWPRSCSIIFPRYLYLLVLSMSLP